MMRARGIVLTGIVAAGVLGASAQAGTVLEEPDESGLGWWSGGAGEEGIGSAPLPMPVADSGDWTPRRGSLYGAIRRTPPHRVVVPSADRGWRADVFPANGGIGVLAAGGSQAQTTAGGLIVCAPLDVSDISTALLGGANTVLWSGTLFSLSDGGTSSQGGSYAENIGLSLDLGGFSLIGSGSLSSGGLADGYGNQWTIGPEGTLTPVVNTLSPVPEPGSLALAGLGFLLAAWQARNGMRVPSFTHGRSEELTG